MEKQQNSQMNITEILKNEPAYRIKQIYKAWFDLEIEDYTQISTLPKVLREKLVDIPWMSTKLFVLQESKIDGTKKALLELSDGNKIETVLIERKSKKIDEKSRYSVCISSQVGCAMKCSFCSTGTLGFKRNLEVSEIVDQIRFWQKYIFENIDKELSIRNIVVMGQGEPLLNYENIKDALNIILNNTSIGETHIALSTSGIQKGMTQMVEDLEFPPVLFALSLHSAISETRKKLMPTHTDDFFDFLIKWSEDYHERWGSRSHFIGIEYLFIKGVNDDKKHLKALIKLISKLGKTKINLIPYNASLTDNISGSKMDVLEHWQQKIMDAGFICTIRRSQGQDISAACGQLALKK